VKGAVTEQGIVEVRGRRRESVIYLDKFLNSLHNNIKFTMETEKDGH
jgi:hypothetical protein